jgi:hypothetical protein
MVKPSSNPGDWAVVDSMRGNATLSGTTNTEQLLFANTSAAESSSYGYANPTSTGFQAAGWGVGTSFIYIAIRRGPMKVPTTGTSVFDSVAYSGTGTNSRTISSLVNPDLAFYTYRNTTSSKAWYTRLQGNGNGLSSNGTGAEYGVSTVYGPQFNSVQTGYVQGTDDGVFGGMNASGNTFITYLMRRAPGFFDGVCWVSSGTSSNERVTHNLGVAPELILMKQRDGTNNWYSYNAAQGIDFWLAPNLTNASTNRASTWGTSNPTATDFGVAANYFYGSGPRNLVAYLFATCPGVSKVGSYTGTGTPQTINCGFTGGARFVMIKRTDAADNWYVYDTARGISTFVNGDKELSLNTTAQEFDVNTINPNSSGFDVTAYLNSSGGSYIFLAIA